MMGSYAQLPGNKNYAQKSELQFHTKTATTLHTQSNSQRSSA